MEKWEHSWSYAKDANLIQETLNSKSEKGWELVSVLGSYDEGYTFFWKRKYN